MEEKNSGAILIVDDTKLMRRILREIFERNGYNVVGEASNGEEAIKIYERLLPDLTTLDIAMPKMDGITALKAIRKINPMAQIIIVSADGLQKNILAAVKAGAKDFVVKPFEEEKILQIAKSLLQNK